MSEIKVNKISPRTNCGTVQLGDSGDTITIPAGATITNNGTQTGFGRTGTVNWQTTIKTGNFTAADGEGYFVDTNGGSITANLPAGTAGAIVAFKDYRNTFDTAALVVTPNGTDKIGGVNANATFSTEAQSVTLIFTDSTRGWIDIHDSTTAAEGNAFIVASGGTETTCGNFKIHTFTGPGTFSVSGAASSAADNVVSYLVVGGGGSAGDQYYAGGGGAGGFRFLNSTCMPAPQSSPLDGFPTPANRVTVTVSSFPIAVGGGGALNTNAAGSDGVASSFSTITAAGGGGGTNGCGPSGNNGGSGGGGGGTFSGGTGNTPSVSPAQGNNGGNGGTAPQGPQGNSGGGGGGASTAGVNSTNGAPQSGNSGTAGDGGQGSYVVSAGFAGCNGDTGPVSGARYFSGGGGGGSNSTGGPNGAGGDGGGGRGAPSSIAGTANTGGGGGGGSHAGNPPSQGSAGGSGIVIIRYKFQ